MDTNAATAPFIHRSEPRQHGKTALIDALLARGQFLVEVRPKIVRNGLSTDMMVFPTDVERRVAPEGTILEEKITDAIEYAAGFNDVQRLNALQYVPGSYKEEESAESRKYLTLGLYLYFADECSRKNPRTTFLSALRDADARLPKRTKFDSETLYAKVADALRRAGIDTPNNLEVLRQWYEQGTYAIAGENHYCGKGGEMHGAYAQLAQAIERKHQAAHKNGATIGIDEAISYALGNKDHMAAFGGEGEENDARAYAHVKDTMKNPQQINEHIAAGDAIRREKIRQLIFGDEEKAPMFSSAEILASKFKQTGYASFNRQILDYFPEDALELMLRDRQTFVYADATDIRGVMPNEAIPGTTEEEAETTRKSIGGRDIRYRIGFFSNGTHDDGDPALKRMRLAQTCIHEMMHIAYGYMSQEEKDHLAELAEKTARALRGGDEDDTRQPEDFVFPAYAALGRDAGTLKTLDQNSLAETLDYHSALYNVYREETRRDNPDFVIRKDSRREEVLCNLYGLRHTEFKGVDDPKNPMFMPPAGMEIIREFAEKADEYFHTALERLRERQRDEGRALPLCEGKSRGI